MQMQMNMFIVVLTFAVNVSLRLQAGMTDASLPTFIGKLHLATKPVTCSKYKVHFNCSACENYDHPIPNLQVMLEAHGETCKIKGSVDTTRKTELTLVDTSTLPREICKTNEDESGYSYEAHEDEYTGLLYTMCNAIYSAVFKKTWQVSRTFEESGIAGDQINNAFLKLPLLEQFSGIRGYDVNTTYGSHQVLLIWPHEGTCTQKHKCMLFVHLHALFETAMPSNAMCSSVPKYVTADISCYRSLRSVVLIPMLDRNLLVETWNPDNSFVPETLRNALPEYHQVFDNILFPVVDKFLEEHNDIIDLDRVHIGGASSGANGVMYAALKRPDIFSIAVASDPCGVGLLSGVQKELLDNLPPPNMRRLRRVIIGRGDLTNTLSICRSGNLWKANDPFSMDTVADLASKVPLHVRIYSELGHGAWGHLFNQWPALHDVLFTGTKTDV